MVDEPESSEKLSKILEALANPIVRHFIELVALAPRTNEDFLEHFDIEYGHVSRVATLLESIELIRRESAVYNFNGSGLEQVQKWLDRIALIRSPRVGAPGTN